MFLPKIVFMYGLWLGRRKHNFQKAFQKTLKGRARLAALRTLVSRRPTDGFCPLYPTRPRPRRRFLSLCRPLDSPAEIQFSKTALPVLTYRLRIPLQPAHSAYFRL